MDADFVKDHLHWDPQNQSIYSDVPIGFTGELKIWPMSTPPSGWLVCDGSLYKKADYPRLWALLGDTWGTSTTTQFYVPNLKGKVPVGRDSGQTEFASIAQSGGDKNLQNHQHGLPGNVGYYVGSGGQFSFNSVPGGNGNFYGPSITGGAGSGSSGNLQPYAVINYIIKA
jgi:microcystin-dependent protein